jgi:hypothetical protein
MNPPDTAASDSKSLVLLDAELRKAFPNIVQVNRSLPEHAAGYVQNAIAACLTALETPNLPAHFAVRLGQILDDWSNIPPHSIKHKKLLNFRAHNDAFGAHVPDMDALPATLNSAAATQLISDLLSLREAIKAARESWLAQPANPTYLNQKLPTYAAWENLIEARLSAIYLKLEHGSCTAQTAPDTHPK